MSISVTRCGDSFTVDGVEFYEDGIDLWSYELNALHAALGEHVTEGAAFGSVLAEALPLARANVVWHIHGKDVDDVGTEQVLCPYCRQALTTGSRTCAECGAVVMKEWIPSYAYASLEQEAAPLHSKAHDQQDQLRPQATASRSLAQRAYEQASALELRTQARNRDSRLSALERRVGVLTSTMDRHMNKETP